MPLFYVTNPQYIRLLLEPVMQYLSTGRWRQPYAIHDIGSTYPNAVGHDDQAGVYIPVHTLHSTQCPMALGMISGQQRGSSTKALLYNTTKICIVVLLIPNPQQPSPNQSKNAETSSS